jgi:hypothetical protein
MSSHATSALQPALRLCFQSTCAGSQHGANGGRLFHEFASALLHGETFKVIMIPNANH